MGEQRRLVAGPASVITAPLLLGSLTVHWAALGLLPGTLKPLRECELGVAMSLRHMRLCSGPSDKGSASVLAWTLP